MRIYLSIAFLFALSYCQAQVYSTRSFQKIEGSRQYSSAGIGIGADSTESMSNAKRNAEKAVEMARTSGRTGQFSDETGSGTAVISEMYKVDIMDLFPLPASYTEVMAYELGHAAYLDHAGPTSKVEWVNYSRDNRMQTMIESEGTEVKGTRKTIYSDFICAFRYSGEFQSAQNPGPDQQIPHTAEMDKMTHVSYVWKAGEDKKLAKYNFEALYEDLKTKLTDQLGEPIDLDKNFRSKSYRGYKTKWNNVTIEFSQVRKSGKYRVRYSSGV